MVKFVHLYDPRLDMNIIMFDKKQTNLGQKGLAHLEFLFYQIFTLVYIAQVLLGMYFILIQMVRTFNQIVFAVKRL